MFTPDDRWQYYIDAGWAQAQIETGPRDESTCSAVQYGRRIGNLTIADALVVAEKHGETSLELLRWLAANMLEVLSLEARELLLGTISRLDPPTAAVLYCWHPNLTDAEDELLKAAFFPTMALMRHKVESGTCPRAKDRD